MASTSFRGDDRGTAASCDDAVEDDVLQAVAIDDLGHGAEVDELLGGEVGPGGVHEDADERREFEDPAVEHGVGAARMTMPWWNDLVRSPPVMLRMREQPSASPPSSVRRPALRRCSVGSCSADAVVEGAEDVLAASVVGVASMRVVDVVVDVEVAVCGVVVVVSAAPPQQAAPTSASDEDPVHGAT